MTQVNVQEAKTHLSKLLGLVESGEEVVIARYGKPVAKLVSAAPTAANRVRGTWASVIEIADDFDDEMPEEWMEPLAELPLFHRDPFDRMLVAQALVEKVPILTADAKIGLYDVETIS